MSGKTVSIFAVEDAAVYLEYTRLLLETMHRAYISNISHPVWNKEVQFALTNIAFKDADQAGANLICNSGAYDLCQNYESISGCLDMVMIRLNTLQSTLDKLYGKNSEPDLSDVSKHLD